MGADGSTYYDRMLCTPAYALTTATPTPFTVGINFQPTAAPTAVGGGIDAGAARTAVTLSGSTAGSMAPLFTCGEMSSSGAVPSPLRTYFADGKVHPLQGGPPDGIIIYSGG